MFLIYCIYVHFYHLFYDIGYCYFEFMYHHYMNPLKYMIWLFMHHCYWHVIDMTLLLSDLIGYWYTICGTKCYVEQSVTWSKVPYHIHEWWSHLLNLLESPLEFMGATSTIPHLLFHVVKFNDINIAQVLLSWYILHALLLFLLHCIVHFW